MPCDCQQYRPAAVLATQEGELLDRDIETAFAEVKRTTNLLGAWDYKDCPYAHEKMWKDGCKKGIEIAMQNTDLTAALSFEAGQRSERARIAKELWKYHGYIACNGQCPFCDYIKKLSGEGEGE